MIKTTKIGKYGDVKFDDSKIKELASVFMGNYEIRVGILGSSQHARKLEETRKTSVTNKKGAIVKGKETAPVTNASIGALHEFGSYSRHIRPRSWLRMPIETQFPKQKNLLARIMEQALGQRNLMAYLNGLKKIGIAAEGDIQRAFDTRGFGSWWINPLTHRGTLIQTAQLRKSVTSGIFPK